MHKYSLHNYSFKTMGCLVIKNQDKDTTPFVEYNVTENKMNKTKINERQ